MNLHKTGRLALVTATSGFMVGLAFLSGGSSNAIGGLCNGEPASHTWLDASGQYGPALIDGTDHDDTIIGSDGDDILDGGKGVDTVVGDGGNDTVAGGHDSDMLYGGSGDDVMIGADDHSEDKVEAGDDFDVCLFGAGDELGDCEY